MTDTPASLSPQGSEERLVAGRRMLAVTEEELQHIILDIHDGPVQKLFAALSQVLVLQPRARQCGDQELEQGLNRISGLLEASLSEIKTFLGTFRPPEFHKRSLLSVVEGLILQHEALTGNGVDLVIDVDLPNVSLPVKIALYRILQEALSNGYRHAGVDHQTVRLWTERGQVCLEVADDGRGFDPPEMTGPAATERGEHIGLRGMRDRVELVGGEFVLSSRPGKGTRITVKVPIE